MTTTTTVGKWLMDSGGGKEDSNKRCRNIVMVALCFWIGFYYLNSAGDFERDFRQPTPARFSSDLEYLKFRNFIQGSRDDSTTKNDSSVKKILLFTPYFDLETWGLEMGSAAFEQCPVSNCRLTNNRDELGSLANFDAILFHLRNMNSGRRVPVPNQRRRRPQQRYIMFLMESPQHDNFHYDRFKDFFNWTMTYRLDSDIPHPYGRVTPLNSNSSYPQKLSETGNWEHSYNESRFASTLESRTNEFRALSKRSKAVAWVVSNCASESDRENYVRELRRHIQVDIFGGCSKRKCDIKYQGGRSSRLDNCTATVERDYMFYLSFENSLCDQYITEKLWSRLKMNVVPVVLGQANYSAIVPPHSLINAMDYPEPRDLAAHLKRLMANKTEYLSYFWWKDFYRVETNMKLHAFCQLCKMLNDPKEPVKVRDHLNAWWKIGGHCKRKGSYPWSKYRPSSLVDNWLVKSILGEDSI